MLLTVLMTPRCIPGIAVSSGDAVDDDDDDDDDDNIQRHLHSYGVPVIYSSRTDDAFAMLFAVYVRLYEVVKYPVAAAHPWNSLPQHVMSAPYRVSQKK